MPDIIVYDVEIQKAIPAKGKPRLRDVEYCQGWDDKANMGIAVVGAYDLAHQQYRAFSDDANVSSVEFKSQLHPDPIVVDIEPLDVLVDLAPHYCGIGFNNITFDSLVMHASKKALFFQHEFDLYREYLVAKGLNPFPDVYDYRYKGHGVDDFASANGWPRKTGHGADAPMKWQHGHHAEVIAYCLGDIDAELCMTLAALSRTPIRDPKNITRSFILPYPFPAANA